MIPVRHLGRSRLRGRVRKRVTIVNVGRFESLAVLRRHAQLALIEALDCRRPMTPRETWPRLRLLSQRR
jgi:hypothetical protein